MIGKSMEKLYEKEENVEKGRVRVKEEEKEKGKPLTLNNPKFK